MATISVVVLGSMIAFGISASIGAAILFVTSALAAACYLQAKNKFCVAYAFLGVYSSSDKYSDTKAVVGSVNKKIDKGHANKMYVQ
jgi:hypothetical protein